MMDYGPYRTFFKLFRSVALVVTTPSHDDTHAKSSGDEGIQIATQPEAQTVLDVDELESES